MKLTDYSIEELEAFKLKRRLPEECELSFEELPEELQEKLLKHRRNIRKMIDVVLKWKLKDNNNIEEELKEEVEKAERREREIKYSPAIPLSLREEKIKLKKEELELKKLKLEREEAILSRLNSLIDEIRELKEEIKMKRCKRCGKPSLEDVCSYCLIEDILKGLKELHTILASPNEEEKESENEQE